MVDLDISEVEINLLSNQRTSIVVDGISHKLNKDTSGKVIIEDTDGAPEIANYGFVKIGNSFELRCKKATINPNREESFKLISGTEEASITNMPIRCANGKKEKKPTEQGSSSSLMGYTIKTHPQFGAYGFVNYNNNDNTDFLFGLSLDENFYGGDIFNATQ